MNDNYHSYYELLNIPDDGSSSKERICSNFTKSDKMYVPYVAFIKEGRILGCWTGTVDDHDLKKGLWSL